MLGDHRRNTHHAHHQKDREENYCNHEDWHTSPLATFCGGNKPYAVMAITVGCEAYPDATRGVRASLCQMPLEELLSDSKAATPRKRGQSASARLVQSGDLRVQTGQGTAQQLRIAIAVALLHLLQYPLSRQHQVALF